MKTNFKYTSETYNDLLSLFNYTSVAMLWK